MVCFLRSLSRTTGITTVVVSCLWSAVAIAQTPSAETRAPAAPNPANTTASSDQADIVVTATRRPERLQKIPIAVTIVGGERLRADNLNNMRDIARIVPSLNYRNAASSKDQALALRGLGTVSTSPGVEPSVATVIDGVVIGRQGQAVMDLLDIDRIEVLRGPQGTLFGKNASAGVLNIVTKTPSNETRGFFDLGYYGRGNEWRVGAGVSGPIVADKIAASVTGFSGHYDGNVKNVWNGETVNGYSRQGVRAKLAFTPAESLKIQFAADYVHSKDTTPQGVVASTALIAYPTNAVTNFPAFATALAPVVPSADNRQINSNYDTHAVDENWGISGQADLSLGDFTLTSITAYRHWTNHQLQDQDRLPQALAAFPQQHDIGDLAYHQFSEEIRLASPKGGFIDYQLGLYYFRGADDETYRRDTTLVSGATSRVVTGIAAYGTTNTSYAGFGEANLHFTDKFRGTAGFRVTHDDLSYDFNRVSTSPTPVTGIQTSFASSGKTHATDYSARAGLQYDLSQRVMAYFTYGRGYKGPAYNLAFSMLPQDTGALKPETSNAYEAGLKSTLLGGAVLFNVAAFLDKFKNFQVNFFDVYNGSPVTRLINAGQVSTRGVEADMSARLSRAFSLSGSVAYTDAHIDKFTCPVGTSAACNVNGKPLPFAPKWKGSVRATYLAPMSGRFDLRLTTDASAQSKVQYSINQTPTTIQSGYGIWNASVGLVAHSGWEVNLVVKNITNKSYASYLQTFGSGVVRFVPRDDRRYVGANLRVNIGQR